MRSATPISLYRVFSYLDGAPDDKPGGAFFIPPQGAGRVDNPDYYEALYVSIEAEAAVAEAFGSLPSAIWTNDILRGHPRLPGSVRALARYERSTIHDICDLDDPRQLVEQRLRPSLVITRDYGITQSWALQIFKQKRVPRWVGVRWWSYYEGRWSSIALWSRSGLKLAGVTPLHLQHGAVVAAAQTIARQIQLN